MKLTERMYLRLVGRTGRWIRDGKRGHISPEVTPVLDAWVKDVENCGELLYRVAGKVDELVQAAKGGWELRRDASATFLSLKIDGVLGKGYEIVSIVGVFESVHDVGRRAGIELKARTL